MKQPSLLTLAILLVGILSGNLWADEETASDDAGMQVKITRQLESVDVSHEGKALTIMRNQDTENTIDPGFIKTSRKCPPFCIQPMVAAPGVETIGELQVLEYLENIAAGDDKILVIDSRSEAWVERGTIPGSINLHFRKLSSNSEENIADILEDLFDVTRGNALYNFSYAKTLVFFCNGVWCGQSPTNIKSLVKLGYPPHKIKYFRGGMQSWQNLGLTTVKPE